jgi:hypothetical protein
MRSATATTTVVTATTTAAVKTTASATTMAASTMLGKCRSRNHHQRERRANYRECFPKGGLHFDTSNLQNPRAAGSSRNGFYTI